MTFRITIPSYRRCEHMLILSVSCILLALALTASLAFVLVLRVVSLFLSSKAGKWLSNVTSRPQST